MTPSQLILFDIISDRIITYMSDLKRIPSMTEEEVDAETAKWDTERKAEGKRTDGH